MRIGEALEVIRGAPSIGSEFKVLLACGFSPLHLQTFLRAHLQQRKQNHRVSVAVGAYGDLIGTIESARALQPDGIVVVLEWQDIDSRFAHRESGAWNRAFETEISTGRHDRMGRVETAIRRAADSTPVVVSLPALPLPPAFSANPWEASEAELRLREEVFALGRRLKQIPGVKIAKVAWTSEAGSGASSHDIKSDILLGFPLDTRYADRAAEAYARLLSPAPPLKGIITDLDNTLWHGIVGEIGPDAVRWDPATRYHLHGLYQKVLASLAEDGVLVAVASKNDPSVVAAAMGRSDLMLPADKIFPIEAGWGAKSDAVGRILRAWNILPEAVAFVDDTALELAEVSQAHPGITTVQFPTGDYPGVLAVLHELRGLFAKGYRTAEDDLRMASLRSGVMFHEQAATTGSNDAFLSSIQAVITFDFAAGYTTERALELINKTNQFNLNGRRYTQAEWMSEIEAPESFLAVAKYEDRFGPLGTIAVLQGQARDSEVRLNTWVMSCRAFSRRIEHQIVKILFETFEAERISFDFVPTPKNGPIREFLQSVTSLEHGEKA